MITIRQATRDDLPALVSLYEQLEDMGPIWSDARFSSEDLNLSREAFSRLAQYPDYHIYVAQVGEELVGTVALLIMDSVANGIPSGVVESLVVARPWRGKGVGRQLMTFAIDHCRTKGCFELTVKSRLENAAAHRFYESVGLRRRAFTFAIKTVP